MRRFVLLIVTVLSTGLLAYAQNKHITGTITDASGQPVVGATVLVEGTSLGTTTLPNGRYDIKAPANGTLVVSFLGFQPVKVAIANKTQIDIQLQEDSQAISDVIVVAYGTAKKESFTGSVAVIKSDDLEHRKVSNVTKALDGLAPGVQVTSGTGQPGSGSSVMIRGFGSINASASPLYVVDGIPYDGAISAINPSDIANISILKDASASALYGARGANGVVLITTKKGQTGGGISVDLKVNIGLASRAIPRYETVGAKDYMELMYSAFENAYPGQAALAMAYSSEKILGDNQMYNPYDLPVEQLFDENGKVKKEAKLRWDEDWLGEVTDNAALRQEYGVTVSGGNKNTQYLLSLGYLNEDGVLQTTNFERYSGRVSVDTQAKPWLAAGLNANFARSLTNSSQTESGALSNVFDSAQQMAPIYPVYQRDPATGKHLLDASGNKMFDYGASRPAGQQKNFNSIATLYDDKYEAIAYSLSARSHIDLTGVEKHWSEGLKFSVNFGLDYYNSSSMTYYNPFQGNAASVNGRIQKANGTSLGYTFNQLLSYNRSFGKHNVDVLVGHEYYSYNSSSLSGHKTGLPGAGIYELDAAAVIVGTGSSTDEESIESVFARAGYNFDDKYYLSASWRTDGSSRFAAKHRWGNFWSVGASWRLSQESWLKDAYWLDNLTFRASYGVQGNNNVSSLYAYQALYDTSYTNATLPGAAIGSVANEDLTWESNHNLNVGVQGHFLNRIGFSIEYYNRKTSDMLLSYPLASSTGFSGYYRNSGSMRNSGVEIALTGRLIDSPSVKWDLTWMGSTVDNKVLKLTEDGKDIISSAQIIREGEELYSFYVAQSAGVDPMTGDKLYWAKDENGKQYVTTSTSKALANRKIAGSCMPDLYGSVSTSLQWKGLDFSVSTSYSIGGKVYDSAYQGFMDCYYVATAKHKNLLRAWRKPGDITDVPKLKIGDTPIPTDDMLINASYFAIKNITLGYTFPAKWTNKIGMKALRLSASVDNLWTFSHLRGMDPQASLYGINGLSYVPTRTVSFNLDIKF